MRRLPTPVQGTPLPGTPIPDIRTRLLGWLGSTPRGTIAYAEESKPQPSRMIRPAPAEPARVPAVPARVPAVPARAPAVPSPSPTDRLRQYFDQRPWVFYLLVTLAVGLTIFGIFMVIIPGLNPHAPSNTNENGNQFRHVTEAPKPLQSSTKHPAPRASISKEVLPSTTSTNAATISKKVMPITTSTNTATTSKSVMPTTASTNTATTSKKVISPTPSTSVTSAECPSPQGSFLDTCQVTGSAYQSTDPNLQSTTMCKYDLHCEKLDGTVQSTSIYVQKSMRGCLKFFENCDGQPVLRDGNARVCITPDAIERESHIKMDL